MYRFLGFIILLVATSCAVQKANVDDSTAINRADLLQNITVLASDSFLGRMPFTEGETHTVRFLEQKFKELGLSPGNGNSYIQEVPLLEISPTADTTMKVMAGGKEFTLSAPREYLITSEKPIGKVELDKTQIVFAGYGVNAPEYNWNDYAGLDVKGKIVMVMVNDPGFWNNDTTLFKGRTMTYYGRWTYKFEEAARQGAKGCLVIHRTSAAGYPFRVLQSGFNSPSLREDDRTSNEPYCDATGWITDTAATQLLKAAGYDESLFDSANDRNFKAIPLDVYVSTSISIKHKYNTSANVIAKVEGTKRPEEVVIYTAHWDHLGIGLPDETGDSIYNGALDNATGTAGLLELAKAFQQSDVRPERSVVFLAVTAEEQGLLGSEYYAAHPVYPVEKTAAAINMDVLNTYGVTKDLVAVGKGQSELEDYLEEVLKSKGGYLRADGSPETGGYFRSDHFNFAKVGIPALYAGSGFDVVGKEKGYGMKMRTEYTAKNYHRPSDEVNPSWNLEGAVNDLRSLYEVGKRVAMQESWPQWKEGSEFRGRR